MMKLIKTFENSERLVRLFFDETKKEYTVSLLAHNNKYAGAIYKSLFWAERKFNDYKNNPLETIKS